MGLASSKSVAHPSRSEGISESVSNGRDGCTRSEYPRGQTVAEAGLLYLRSVPGLCIQEENWRQGSTSRVHRAIYKGVKAAVKQVRY